MRKLKHLVPGLKPPLKYLSTLATCGLFDSIGFWVWNGFVWCFMVRSALRVLKWTKKTILRQNRLRFVATQMASLFLRSSTGIKREISKLRMELFWEWTREIVRERGRNISPRKCFSPIWFSKRGCMHVNACVKILRPGVCDVPLLWWGATLCL